MSKYMNAWTVRGAEDRLKELEAEAAQIRKFLGAKAGGQKAAKKRRFSAKGKAAISEGMRRYWARRKAQVKKAKKTPKE